MENFESLEEIPSLSGQVTLLSFKPLFNGAYSSVFRGKLGDQLVAVKVLKEIYGADVRTMQRKLKRERTTWGHLRHPNVLPLLGFADDHEMFHPYGALVSPWRAEGNACEFLKSRGNEMSIFRRVDMWKGVVAGVAYLHNHIPVLVHGDLKSANVLICNNHEPQICDFGLVSIFLEEGSSGMTTTSAHTGTDRYLAYELVRGGETVAPTAASDMFALGCIGLEFCFLQQPYAHRKNNMRGQIFIDIRAGVPPATRPPPSGPWDDALWAALDRCWEGHPGDRIGARDLQTQLEEALRKGGIMPQPHMFHNTSAFGGQFPAQLNAENSTASHAASTIHPAGTSYRSQYRAQDTTTTDNHTIVPILNAPGFWGSGMLPETGDIMAAQHFATETGTTGPFTEELFGVPPAAHDSGMTSGETRRKRLFKPLQNDSLLDLALNTSQALSFLDSVKSRFPDHPESYYRFLDIMKDFKTGVINHETVIEQVARLLLGHSDLINDFNVFLPVGYHIEIGSQGSVVAHTPGGLIEFPGYAL